MGIFSSFVELAEDAGRLVAAPVEIALDITGAIVKPLADGAQVVVEEVKQLTKD